MKKNQTNKRRECSVNTFDSITGMYDKLEVKLKILRVTVPFLLCFIVYLRAISNYKASGAYVRRVFCVTSLGGLYMEGLIFGILR